MALTLRPIRCLAPLLGIVACLAMPRRAEALSVSGPVRGVWTTAMSPILATGDCSIADGTTLTIMPGVQVLLAPGATLTVDGSLTAIGSATQPIEIAPSGTGPWRAIRVTMSGEAAFQQCFIHGGGLSNAEENTGMIRVDGGWTSLVGCTLSDSVSSAVYVNSGYITVSGCHLRHSGGSQPSDAAIHVVSGYVTMGRDNDANSITDCVFGLYNDSLVPVDASGTWWGAATGPQHASNVLGQGVSVSDDVIYDNFIVLNPDPTPGDLDRDGLVTVHDVALALSIAGGLTPATSSTVALGDLVPDRHLDVRDAQAILCLAMGAVTLP